MPFTPRTLSALSVGALLCALVQQGAAATDPPPAILPLPSEAESILIAYPPLPEPLARGVVIIQYRTEHTRVMAVFGKAAVEVSPRLGHLHVTLDDLQGTWAHTSEDPIILVGLTPGAHKVLLEVADPTHRILTGTTVSFVVPPTQPMAVSQADEAHSPTP